MQRKNFNHSLQKGRRYGKLEKIFESGLLILSLLSFLLLSQAGATDLSDVKTYTDPGKVARLLHKPQTPEEALVYDFVDWCIDRIEGLDPQGKVKVETNNAYKPVKTDDGYEVKLSPFSIRLSKRERLEFGQVLFKCRPLSATRLDFVVILPERFALKKKDEVEAELSWAKRDVSGQWDKKMETFRNYSTLIEDFVVTDPEDTARLRIAGFTLNGHLSFEEGGKWNQKVEGLLRGVDFDLHDGAERLNFQLRGLGFSGDTSATNYEEYTEARRRLGSAIFKSDRLTLEDAEKLVQGLDAIFKNMGKDDMKVTLDGLKVKASDDNVTMHTGSVTITSSYQKKPGKKTRVSGDVRMAVSDFGFSQMDSKTKGPVSVKMGQIRLTNKVESGVIPPGFFASIRLDGNATSGKTMTEREKVEWYLSQATKKWSDVIEKASLDLNFKDVDAVTTKSPAFKCASVWFGFGLDFRPSRDNAVRINAGYSDFDSPAFKERIKSANLFLRLANLPEFKELLPESKGGADPGRQMVDKLQKTLKQKTMELSVMASFMGVPQSAATLDMDIKSDPKAKFMSTGSINLTLEAPDNFMKIIQALYPKPGLLQMIATITALGQRVEKDGKVVDKLNLTIDRQGRIFLNNKDITNMFFPPAGDQGNGSRPQGHQGAKGETHT